MAFSIYVHVPFCLSKCHYCAFYSEPIGVNNETATAVPTADQNSFEAGCDPGRSKRTVPTIPRCLSEARETTLIRASRLESAQPEAEFAGWLSGDTPHWGVSSRASIFLEGLVQEIELRRQDALPGASSLFIGGGTPTALSEDELGRLFSLLKQAFVMEPGAEISVEGNPGTLTEQKIGILVNGGVNRYSLGVQAFDDRILRRIGRRHTAAQARRGIALLRSAGVRNLNLDLMFGLPGQTIEGWQDCVEEALQYNPEHLSLYGLTLEEGTVLARQAADGLLTGDAVLPDEDRQADMYAWAVERLSQAGYRHYETSNFARPGYECRHNITYWRGGDYLGLGPGAVSCRDGVRWRNAENVGRYRNKLAQGREPVVEREVLSTRERMAERLMLGLRTADGVDLAKFEADFGQAVDDIFTAALAKHLASGALFRTNGYLRLLPAYAFIANAILRDFV